MENERLGKENIKEQLESKSKSIIIQKYTIYQTDERIYVIGSNNRETLFRILEIDLTIPVSELSLIEDNIYFNRKEIHEILETLRETKDITKKLTCFGLLGFVKFTNHYYLHCITKKSIAGVIGGHYIFKIDSTELLPIINDISLFEFEQNINENENRFLSIFKNFSLDDYFYFSYTYDITNSLQKNFLSEKFKSWNQGRRNFNLITLYNKASKNEGLLFNNDSSDNSSSSGRSSSTSGEEYAANRKYSLDRDDQNNPNVENEGGITNPTYQENSSKNKNSNSSFKSKFKNDNTQGSITELNSFQGNEKESGNQQEIYLEKPQHDENVENIRESEPLSNEIFEKAINSDFSNDDNNIQNNDHILEFTKFEDETINNYNTMFIWNLALLKPVLKIFNRTFDWFQPIIYGFFDQKNISIYNKKITISLIARRSHHFAGARFLKRGVNNQGNVANEVETEQIVCNNSTTSFHNCRHGYFMNDNYSSFVQLRGSIPLFWTQDQSLKISKPPIIVTLNDPFYSVSAVHFDKLIKRYGTTVSILNLIKQKEKVPRESILGKEFENCVNFLNKFSNNKLKYRAWDMSKASKIDDNGFNVLRYLENYADEVMNEIGFFHNDSFQDLSNLQNGICRVNCIDCLDRTNAAQFIIGKRVLGYQLKKLNIIDDIYLDYDSEAINIFNGMFHNHGNILALQYGGSNLVNTMETYRKTNNWNSKKNDLIENFKRFYSNSFIDPIRQDTINLFLGNYDFSKSKILLWELDNDYYLHNDLKNYQNLRSKQIRSYNYWWNQNIIDYYNNFKFPPENFLLNGEYNYFNEKDFQKFMTFPEIKRIKHLNYFRKLLVKKLKLLKNYKLIPVINDNYFNEYYTPRKLTNFGVLFDMNLQNPDGDSLSPFDSKMINKLDKEIKEATSNNSSYSNESETYAIRKKHKEPLLIRRIIANRKTKYDTSKKELDDGEERRSIKDEISEKSLKQSIERDEHSKLDTSINKYSILEEEGIMSEEMMEEMINERYSEQLFTEQLNNLNNSAKTMNMFISNKVSYLNDQFKIPIFDYESTNFVNIKDESSINNNGEKNINEKEDYDYNLINKNYNIRNDNLHDFDIIKTEDYDEKYKTYFELNNSYAKSINQSNNDALEYSLNIGRGNNTSFYKKQGDYSAFEKSNISRKLRNVNSITAFYDY